LEIYGLPRDQFWGDVVTMNRLAEGPDGCLLLARDRAGNAYYLEVGWRDEDTGGPVTRVGPTGQSQPVADNFWDFFSKATDGELG
jgi:hypothetical protein